MATKGLLAKKIGMTQVFTEKGELLPVTVLEAGPCTVVALRSTQKDGYGAVQLGFGQVKDKHLNKASAGHFKKANVTPHRHLREVRLKADGGSYEVGQALKADLFKAGELVDVTGTSKGKGFSGLENPLFFKPVTGMLYGDAKSSLTALTQAVQKV